MNTLICSGGVCDSTCNAGYGNCLMPSAPSADDGCETDISNDVDNCGWCGAPCSTNNISRVCSGGVCVGSCQTGYADCNGNKRSDRCEVNLNDGGGTCSGATDIGSVNGDEYTGFLCTSSSCNAGPSGGGYGEKWYMIYVAEDSNCCADITIWARLDVPSGMDYDLYLYSPCGNLVDYSTATGQLEEVKGSVTDDCGGDDDSRYYYIEVRYYSGSSCANWYLQTWGGCP